MRRLLRGCSTCHSYPRAHLVIIAAEIVRRQYIELLLLLFIFLSAMVFSCNNGIEKASRVTGWGSGPDREDEWYARRCS